MTIPALEPTGTLQIGILDAMPRLPRRRRSPAVPRVIVLGDLVLDVVVAPSRPLESGTDVPGRVSLRQGGSAANTARWLARLGARTTLITAIGRDAAGRALVSAIEADRLTIRVSRLPGARTGRIGVVVGQGGERSFVADRGAADMLRVGDLQTGWFVGVDLLHLPAYSLIAALGPAARRAVELTRAAGGLVSLDLSSVGPLLEGGRRAAVAMVAETAPDVLFATSTEAEALLGLHVADALLDLAPIAVVKRGSKGATVFARESDARLRFEVATERLLVTDTTGAGDAFAGALAAEMASGMPLFEAARVAVRAASLSTTARGARTAMPTRAMLGL